MVTANENTDLVIIEKVIRRITRDENKEFSNVLWRQALNQALNLGDTDGRRVLQKTQRIREKPSQQEREPTTNSIHIWRQRHESNLGHTDRR